MQIDLRKYNNYYYLKLLNCHFVYFNELNLGKNKTFQCYSDYL